MSNSTNEAQSAATCGLVMPISALDGCPQEHWLEVRQIITEAVESLASPKFLVKLVSDADDVGVIQKRIVQNVYTSDVIVCDVSGKNPNVMFELGLRLAFDKATVIVKDDKTDYSFDTGIIEHLTYPRDLRFTRIIEFKKNLAAKVAGTYKAAKEDSQHSPFLKSFGSFQVAKLSEREVSPDKAILEMLLDLQMEMSSLKRVIGNSTERVYADRSNSGLIRIAACVADYQKIRPVGEPVMLTSELKHRIMRDIDAQKYFDNPEDFDRALRCVLDDMSK